MRDQSQTSRYADFYGSFQRLRSLFRFDVHYRRRRTQEVLKTLGIDVGGYRILDVGFGSGDLLESFPTSCEIVGADVSKSAVTAARQNPKFRSFKNARFELIDENKPADLPEGPFDLVFSSHTLEHVLDDQATLKAMGDRLNPDGILVIFVPIEEPDYIPFHVRNYSMQSIVNLIRKVGFDLLFSEGSMHVNGHIWKVLTIPSRRQWPVMEKVVDAFRLATLSIPSYKMMRGMDAGLDKLGFGPRQALVLAQKSS